jgi:hypothetical protein
MEVLESLLGVMKHHDVTRTDMFYHVVETGSGAQVAVVVATKYVPHYYTISFAQLARLLGRDASIGWTEQVGVEQLIGKVDILNIVVALHLPPFLMTVCVVAYFMARVDDSPVDIGIHLHILTQAEECGFGPETIQLFEYPFGHSGSGAVVKGEVDVPAVRYVPHKVGYKFS